LDLYAYMEKLFHLLSLPQGVKSEASEDNPTDSAVEVRPMTDIF
jgi:hypothetical protein